MCGTTLELAFPEPDNDRQKGTLSDSKLRQMDGRQSVGLPSACVTPVVEKQHNQLGSNLIAPLTSHSFTIKAILQVCFVSPHP